MKLDSEESIVAGMASGFPHVFRPHEAVDASEFGKEHAKFAGYAQQAASPFLSDTTLRYQRAVFFAAFLTLFVYAFDPEAVTVLDQELDIDKWSRGILTAFVIFVAVVFGWKSRLDYLIHRMGNVARAEAQQGLRELIRDWESEQRVEYYWLSLCDSISGAYEEFQAIRSEVGGTPPPSSVPHRWDPDLDLKKLKRRESLRKSIESRELLFTELSDALTSDLAELKHRTEQVAPKGAGAFKRVREEYDKTIGKWLEARSKLSSLHLDTALDERDTPAMAGLRLMHRTLKRTVGISRVSILLEVILPISFALSAASLYWLA